MRSWLVSVQMGLQSVSTSCIYIKVIAVFLNGEIKNNHYNLYLHARLKIMRQIVFTDKIKCPFCTV